MNLHLHLHVQRFFTVIGLGVGLVAFSGVAMAQETVAPTINADGRSGRSDAGINPAVDADGPTLVYGDIPGGTVIGSPKEGAAPVTSDVVSAPPGTVGDITATNGDASALGPTGDASAAPGTVTGGTGTALLGPDGTYSVTDAPPSNVTVGESGAPAPAPVTEPVYEPAPEAVAAPVETSEPVAADTAAADTAVASATDADADNYADAAELEVGLDPTNPDADGDGVADGDEVNIYFTDPWVWDTDGDGISDGEELFGILTNPLVWDTDGDGVGDGETVAV
jgi:Bacterial TSP3 repeat